MQRVLLVEDDADMARFVERTLRAVGLTTDWARNGQEAIHLPSMVLMDVMMPHLDGFETTRYLKLRYPQPVPVVILTALDDAQSIDRAWRVGAEFYLTKPVHTRELQEAVQLALALNAAETARDTAELVRVRVALAERLFGRGLLRLAATHLERLRALAPDDPRVRALASRLGDVTSP